MKFNKPYEARKSCPTVIVGDSLTRQADAPMCEINYIVSQYEQSGTLVPYLRNAIAEYGDFTAVNEFKEAQDFVAEAKSSFERIPADIRLRFDNDAGTFFEFASNPANLQEMVDLGLANPVEEIQPMAVKVVGNQVVSPQDEGESSSSANKSDQAPHLM